MKNLKQSVILQELKKKKNPYDNVTTRKRKLLPITSGGRLKELPSIYTEIPTDQSKKIEAAKKVFDKVIKQVPPNNKKIKINYNEKNNITRLYKSSTENMPFFDRKRIFTIYKRAKLENGTFLYWLEEDRSKVKGRFLRQELFALNNQFLR